MKFDATGHEGDYAKTSGVTESTNQDSMSPNINELAAALSKAQAKIGGAKKDSTNPFFKSNYADLESVWEACRKELTDNGLAVIQTMEPSTVGVTIVTTLVHSSGQWMRGKLFLNPTKPDPQGIGSAITYGRRYALAAIVGVYQTDDDANAASEPAASHKSNKRESEVPKPFFITATVDKVKLVAAKDDSQEVWLKLREGKVVSLAITTTDPTMSKLLDSEGSRLKFQVTESGRKYQGDDAEIPKNSPIYTIHNIAAVPTEDLLRDLKKSVETTAKEKAMAKQ